MLAWISCTSASRSQPDVMAPQLHKKQGYCSAHSLREASNVCPCCSTRTSRSKIFVLTKTCACCRCGPSGKQAGSPTGSRQHSAALPHDDTVTVLCGYLPCIPAGPNRHSKQHGIRGLLVAHPHTTSLHLKVVPSDGQICGYPAATSGFSVPSRLRQSEKPVAAVTRLSSN